MGNKKPSDKAVADARAASCDCYRIANDVNAHASECPYALAGYRIALALDAAREEERESAAKLTAAERAVVDAAWEEHRVRYMNEQGLPDAEQRTEDAVISLARERALAAIRAGGG